MHEESFVVYIVGNLNGTRCRDGVKKLPSNLVGFFRVPSLHALVFIQKTFCDLSCCFYFCGFLCVFCTVV